MSSAHSHFFRSIDYMTGTTSQEGSSLFGFLSESLQRRAGFNVTQGISADFMCNSMLRPFIAEYYDGSINILQAACAFYNSSTNANVVSNNAVDLYGDIVFGVDTALILDIHYRPGGCRTYHYHFDRIGPVSLFQAPPYRWVNMGAGHGAELVFLFNNDDAVIGGTFNVNFTTEDRMASRAIIQYWASFAKTG